jgi:hypothetical protein
MRFLCALSVVAVLSCSSSSSEPEASFERGSTFPQLALVGYLDANKDGSLSADEYRNLRPADVARVYPNAELLLVHVAFEWCKYCWEETGDQLSWTRHYAGRFVSMQVMVETRDGEAGDRTLLDRWKQAHKSALPTLLEPAATLRAHFGQNATYLLLDARDDLRVLAVGAGPPQFEVVRAMIGERLGPLPARTDAQ